MFFGGSLLFFSDLVFASPGSLSEPVAPTADATLPATLPIVFAALVRASFDAASSCDCFFAIQCHRRGYSGFCYSTFVLFDQDTYSVRCHAICVDYNILFTASWKAALQTHVDLIKARELTLRSGVLNWQVLIRERHMH